MADANYTEFFRGTLTIPEATADRVIALARERRDQREQFSEHFKMLRAKLFDIGVLPYYDAADSRQAFFSTSVDDEWWTLLVRPERVRKNGRSLQVARLMFDMPEINMLGSGWKLGVHDYFVDLAGSRVAAFADDAEGFMAERDQPVEWQLSRHSGPLAENHDGAVELKIGAAYQAEVTTEPPFEQRLGVLQQLILDLAPIPSSQSDPIASISTTLIT